MQAQSTVVAGIAAVLLTCAVAAPAGAAEKVGPGIGKAVSRGEPQAPAAGQAGGSAWLPLTAGASWQYKLTVAAGGREQSRDLPVVTARPVKVGADNAVVVGSVAYAARDDGVYAVGAATGDRVSALAEPHQVVPAAPEVGQKWAYKDSFGAHAAVVLGSEKVTVPGGEYEAIKVFTSAAGERGRREINQWFARNVGLVKESIVERTAGPDGKLDMREMTTELIAFTPPAGAAPAAGATAGALLAQGEALAKQGKHEAALARYDAAIAADPKDARPLAYRAVSLLALRRYDEAEAAAARAIALDEKNYQNHEVAGQIKVARGDLAAGKALYDKAAGLSKENAGAVYMDLAGVLAAKNDPKLATELEEALKKSAAADPPHPDALFTLGQSYINGKGEVRAQGRRYLQRYVEMASNLPKETRDERKIRVAKQLIRAVDAVMETERR